MKPGLKISFRGTQSLDHVIDFIEKRYDRLRKKKADLISCHVVVDNPHRSQRSGNDYRVSIDLSVPGREFVARSRGGDGDGSVDIFQAVTEAFTALEHQLLSGKRRKGGSHVVAATLFGHEAAGAAWTQ